MTALRSIRPGNRPEVSTKAALAIGGLAVVCYANTRANGFVHDDLLNILANPWIVSARFLGDVFSSHVVGFDPSLPPAYYRPLVNVVNIGGPPGVRGGGLGIPPRQHGLPRGGVDARLRRLGGGLRTAGSRRVRRARRRATLERVRAFWKSLAFPVAETRVSFDIMATSRVRYQVRFEGQPRDLRRVTGAERR